MKLKTIVIALLLLMPFVTKAKEENKIVLQYSFPEPEIKEIEINGEKYDIVLMHSLPLHGDVGKPILPVKPLYILLPPDGKVKDISIEYMEREKLGKFKIPVAEIPKEIGNKKIELIAKEFKPTTYLFRGYKILVLRLQPVYYDGESKFIYYYKKAKVSIDIEKDEISPLLRGLKEDEERVLQIVENPEMILKYREVGKECNKNYDYVIITSRALKDSFQEFIKEKEEYGMNVTVVCVEDIKNNKSFWDSKPIFNDTQAKIRNFIRWAYLNWGIDYVLLGGDASTIPPRYMWVEGELDEWYDVPSDLYYACLDGSFNTDEDSKWGEPNDGESGDVDLIAEVYVGRICADSAGEVENFATKTIEYESKYDDYIAKVLLVGEDLGWTGEARWGGNHLDQIIDECNDGNYTTHGIPSDEYDIYKLYDRDKPWEKEDLMKLLNQGFHIVCHVGHSNYYYNMRMMLDDVMELKNDKYFFAYSIGCMAGGFDNGDCIAEYFTVKTSHGAFAGIWNTRYGWGGGEYPPYDLIDYGSQRYLREFWDAVFGEGIKELGKANQDSKEDNLWRINDVVMRFCYYEITLFGDPSLKLKEVDKNYPTKPEKPKGITKGKAGEEYVFSTVAYDADGDKLYYKWDWGDGNVSKWLGPYEQGEIVNASHSWQRKGVYFVRVKVKDEHGAESEWSDSLAVAIPYVKWNIIDILANIIEKFFQIFFFVQKIMK